MARSHRQIRRLQVYRYDKSGKLAAAFARGGYIGVTVLELSPDMSSILEVQSRKYLKSEGKTATRYCVEIVEEEVEKEGNVTTFQFKLIRILSPEDTDIDRWVRTRSLADLPVSTEAQLTIEERAWAGERPGRVGGGFALITLAGGTAWIAGNEYLKSQGLNFGVLLFAAIALVSGWFLLGYDWKLPRKPLPSKLEELASYKAALRETARETQAAAKTEWRRLLENYANWSALTPQHFETAVSLRLEEEGYRVSVTKYSKDGGVDIEATDQDGRAVIVQAKRYTKNVGVSVVREMIGVRESRENRPHTIIYSLAGFSRDARRLAAEAGIELRDVKQELLKV